MAHTKEPKKSTIIAMFFDSLITLSTKELVSISSIKLSIMFILDIKPFKHLSFLKLLLDNTSLIFLYNISIIIY